MKLNLQRNKKGNSKSQEMGSQGRESREEVAIGEESYLARRWDEKVWLADMFFLASQFRGTGTLNSWLQVLCYAEM